MSADGANAYEDVCPVCLSELSSLDAKITLSCGHVLCGSCIDGASQAGLSACPVCRTPRELILLQFPSTYRV